MAIELDGLFGITSDGNVTTGNYFIGNNLSVINIATQGNGTMLTYNTSTKEIVADIPVLPTFADLAALAIAVPSPVAGSLAYDTGNNKAVCYNGSSWNNLF